MVLLGSVWNCSGYSVRGQKGLAPIPRLISKAPLHEGGGSFCALGMWLFQGDESLVRLIQGKDKAKGKVCKLRAGERKPLAVS